jgi:hypothetical protein
MALEKVALDGRLVRLEPLESATAPPSARRRSIPRFFTVTTSALGPLFDPYIDKRLKRSDGQHELAFVVMHKALGHPSV